VCGNGDGNNCVVTDGDGNRFTQGHSGMDSKFAVMDVDADKCSSLCRRLL